MQLLVQYLVKPCWSVQNKIYFHNFFIKFNSHIQICVYINLTCIINLDCWKSTISLKSYSWNDVCNLYINRLYWLVMVIDPLVLRSLYIFVCSCIGISHLVRTIKFQSVNCRPWCQIEIKDQLHELCGNSFDHLHLCMLLHIKSTVLLKGLSICISHSIPYYYLIIMIFIEWLIFLSI